MTDRNLLIHLRTGVAIFGSDGSLTEVNRSAATLLGMVGADDPWARALDERGRPLAIADRPTEHCRWTGHAHVALLGVELDAGSPRWVWTVTHPLGPIEGQNPPFATVTEVTDITAEVDARRVMAHAATHDALTTLPNRAQFAHLVDRSRARLRSGGSSFAVLFVDLDDFKDINDRFGHAAGDRVLVAAGERIRSALRPGDRVARYGGDEFAVLCHRVDTCEEARIVCRRLAEALRAPLPFDADIALSASVGAALAGSSDEELESLVARADEAMYRAKTRGRGLFELAAAV